VAQMTGAERLAKLQAQGPPLPPAKGTVDPGFPQRLAAYQKAVQDAEARAQREAQGIPEPERVRNYPAPPLPEPSSGSSEPESSETSSSGVRKRPKRASKGAKAGSRSGSPGKRTLARKRSSSRP
jgi:hypothetical protein